LVSQATRDLAGRDGLLDLGEHRLKDLSAPERLYQLGERQFSPLKTLHQTNLPVQPTALVGRARELADVASYLRDGARLVTLTGPGGSGKTRLALQVAAELVDEFPDGVWFVPLAAVADPDLVVSEIAAAVDTAETPGMPLLDALRSALVGKRALLLVDNFEHLLAAGPSLGSVLTASRGLRLLVTSRARLALSGEQEYPVPPLPDAEALALFTARARSLEPDFQPDEAVAEICRRLDGLPLALELAAARIKVLRPHQILDRLERRLDLLTGGARDLPERQRTLRAAIHWSYELLDSRDRALFERLAVFAGSFDLDAAEGVCGADVDTLSVLVDMSLLRQTQQGRFFFLETIREYALELLESSGRVESLRERHAAHFLAIAETEEPEVRGPNEVRAMSRLDAEHDNFRAVLAWAIAGQHADVALRLAGALHTLWYHRAHFSEARRWAEEALALGGGSLLGRVKALGVVGEFAMLQGDNAVAQQALDERLPLAVELDDPGYYFSTLTLLGHVALGRNDVERARDLYAEALEHEERTGSSRVVWQSRTVALNNLGYAMLLLGELDGAQATLDEGLEAARAEGSHMNESVILNNLARIALERRELDSTSTLAQQSLELLRDNRDSRLIFECLELLSRAAAVRGEPERAARLVGAGSALRESMRIGAVDVVPHEELLDAASRALGDAWERMRLDGAAMTLDEVFTYALERD
jgi:predicted ATPase